MIMIRSILSLFVAMCIGYAHSTMAGLLDKDGMADWEICAMCHGADGISHMAKFPKLAGQKADYISKQFKDFYWQRRANDGGQMQAITTEIEMNNLDAVAEYFAQLPIGPAARLGDDVESQQLFVRGKNIFRQVDDDGVSCAGCHELAMNSHAERSGSISDIDFIEAPILFAQHEAYLIKQLEEFKSGVRNNDSTGRMSLAAENLDSESIRAVAFYLARKQTKERSN